MNMDEHAPPSHNRTHPALADKLLSFGMLLVCCAMLIALRCRQLSTGKGGVTCVCVTACSVVVMLLLTLRSRRNLLPTLRHGMLSVTFGASISACLLLTATGVSVYYAHFASVPMADENAFISLLMKAFALLSAAVFIISSASANLSERRSMHLLFTLPPIFYCALRVLNTFINSSTMPLASSGGYRILGMIAAMLFFLNEGKLLLGVKSASAYQLTGFTAAIFCAAYDIPLLVTGIRNGGYSPDAAYSLLTLGLVTYILTRIATLPGRNGEAEE